MHNRLDTPRNRSTLPLLHPVDLGLALDNADAGVMMMIMDAADHIIYTNCSYAEVSGYCVEEAAVWPPQLFQSLQVASEQYQAMQLALRDFGHWCGQVLAQHKNGKSFIAQLDLHALIDADGQLGHYVALFSEAKRGSSSSLLPFSSSLPSSPYAHQPAATPPSPSLARLAQALKQDELVLYYQPKVNMRTGKVVGVEALLRWQHPKSGLMLPGTFLPQAEHDDLIIDIGNWVIRQALAQLVAWQKQGLEISISINIAARHLQCADFVETLKQCLADEPRACPEFLEIEVLESAALENTDHVHSVMDACRELGVSFALDDFGTGYASLAYLRAIPAEVLKIDRSFVKDLLDDSDDLILVEGVISLAKAFRRVVVAEGVETAEHGLMLMRLGCDIAQGFGIACPMPAADVLEWVGSYQSNPQWALWADIPWEMEDFPLLVAQYDHIAWVRRLLNYVKGEPLLLEQNELFDHHKCRFGHWYDHQGKARYGHLPAFNELESIHAYVHKLGPEIVRLYEAGNQTQALSLTQELLDVRDNVLRHLDALQRSVVLDPVGQHNLRQKPMRLGGDATYLPLHLAPNAAPRKLRQPFIYVIDDTPTNIELLAGALSADFTIKFATSGAKALEFLAKTEKPDLILLDVMMPGMDGYEVCRQLKENPTTRGIPIIFITAKSDAADQTRGFSLGAVDYIAKPFELPAVTARVRNHINLKLRTDLLEAQASIDALTGIANRRRFDETLRIEWRRAARNIMPLSLLMFDVDHFKAFNDQYGHGAGDDCLRAIGEALQRAELRPGDFVARYGGEEFAVILPCCHSTGARAIAERVRGIIEGLQIRHEHSSCAPVVTISMGCATQKPALGGDISGLFLAADTALYRAKQEGRNRVCTAIL
jgi:diguanylate cyclase (GGDEF)-like protein